MPRVWNKRDPACPKLGPDVVYVGRPTMYGNPFKLGVDGSRAAVIAKYRAAVLTDPLMRDLVARLRGKDLVCWCAPLPCHADVLLELANAADGDPRVP